MSISIRPVSAQLENDTDTFSKAVHIYLRQDPYVVLILGQ